MNRIPVKSIFQRVLGRAEKVDTLYHTIPEDLRERRETRDSWHQWNTVWKKAWLESDLEDEEKSELREKTSVRRRIK